MIASQLEPHFNEALAQRLGASAVLAIPRGVPQALPSAVSVLVAAPIDPALPAPPGWPFNLAWVQLVTSGTDKHPAWMLEGVPVSTARGVAAEPIAEYVVAAIFDDAKSLATLWIDRPGQWATRPLTAVAGATVGLVGLGAIGTAIARKMLALGARVIAYRQSGRPSDVPGVEVLDTLEAVLSRSDHLVLAAPATPATRHLLNRRSLAHARPGLHIVNIARGELIDDDALLDALAQGTVRRATLDATVPEPLPAGHPHYNHPAVRLSPHTSAIGLPARLALADKVVENLARWRRGAPLLDRVTLPFTAEARTG